MKYMGGKFRIRKHILPIILKDRKEDQWYVEPFCGGCNTLSEVTGNRIGADIHPYLISMWQKVSKEGWLPPRYVPEELWRACKDFPEDIPYLSGYVGFALSFGAVWFGGYARKAPDRGSKSGRIVDPELYSYNSALRQFPKLKDVIFKQQSYEYLEIPPRSIIYCDPPYENTAGYGKVVFDHGRFWCWVRRMAEDEGHTVFVSSYTAPGDFKCVWEKGQLTRFKADINSNGFKLCTERLFVQRRLWKV